MNTHHDGMNRRRFLAACSAGLGAGLLSRFAAATPETPAQPNIILFLVDDMGWQDTSVPFWTEETLFNRHFRTPNMERLANRGIRFTNAYAHTVCSPTRTSLMTGWSPARHRVTNWTLNPDEDTSRGWAPRDWNMRGLQADEVNMAQLLQEAGYFTIHCGKAHWGARGTSGEDPLRLGFDVNIAGHAGGAPGSYQGKDNFGNEENGTRRLPWGVPGLEKYHGKDIDLSDALTKEALAAVDHAVAAEKPFYLYMSHYAVHTPIQPHNRFVDNYKGRTYPDTDINIPPVEARYASMVEGMDASLGALLDKVEALGVAESTLVVFTSDNGGLSAHGRCTTPYNTGLNTHNRPLHAGKGSAYEGGTRVPFIAAWAKPAPTNALQAQLPIKAQAVSAQPLISEDLFPTLLGIGGALDQVPITHTVDGYDLRPYFTQEASDMERPLYFHYPHTWGPEGPGYEPHSAMRLGDWKVIYFYQPQRWELYNLADDIGESHNRAAEEPERLAQMAQKLRRDLVNMGAQWPVNDETDEESPMRLPQDAVINAIH